MKVSRICKTVTLDRSSSSLDAQGVVLRCSLRGSDDSVPATPGSEPAAHGSYALFEVNRQSGELLRIVVVDPGGVQVEFRFSTWRFNPSLQASKFRFEPSKGTAIVDGDFAASADARERKPGR
jgi:hypothetical protein